jgi:hypothetical protein
MEVQIMNDTWVKLYRKINMNAIMRDPVALQLWIWILTNADRKTGTVEFRRYPVARELDVNPNTLYSALKRLISVYKTVNNSSTTNGTTISVSNWDKYQSTQTEEKPSSTSHQQAINNDSIYTRRENKETRIYKERDYLSEIPLTDIDEFTRDYTCSPAQVKSKAEDLLNYCKAKNKRYSDYKAFLRNALKKDFGKRIVSVKFVPDEVAPQISEDQRMRNIARLDEMKKKLVGRMN